MSASPRQARTEFAWGKLKGLREIIDSPGKIAKLDVHFSPEMPRVPDMWFGRDPRRIVFDSNFPATQAAVRGSEASVQGGIIRGGGDHSVEVEHGSERVAEVFGIGRRAPVPLQAPTDAGLRACVFDLVPESGNFVNPHGAIETSRGQES